MARRLAISPSPEIRCNIKALLKGSRPGYRTAGRGTMRKNHANHANHAPHAAKTIQKCLASRVKHFRIYISYIRYLQVASSPHPSSRCRSMVSF